MTRTILIPVFLAALLFFISSSGVAQNQKKEQLPAVSPAGIAADHVNVPYSDHPKSVFDLWLAKSDKPAPLVIYIHGGGFRGGDKSKVYESDDIDYFLKNGISFATINYRFMTNEPLGVRACLYDSKRALQYIRSRAEEWNLDQEKIACYGGSAGAGTSLWLAFHDEMADPDSEDPILRESTRITAAGGVGTQATYNLARWFKILEMESNSEIASASFAFYGITSQQEYDSPEGKAIRDELDMLLLMDDDDPPFYVINQQKGGTPPENRGHTNHHPLHAKALLDRAKEVGLEAYVYAPKIGIAPPEEEQQSMREFLLRMLKKE